MGEAVEGVSKKTVFCIFLKIEKQEEYKALIEYVKMNKENNTDWFKLEANKQGTRWTGRCWVVHNFEKYEFELSFDIPVTYPSAPPALALPGLLYLVWHMVSLFFVLFVFFLNFPFHQTN
jgi:hypothetical protein